MPSLRVTLCLTIFLLQASFTFAQEESTDQEKETATSATVSTDSPDPSAFLFTGAEPKSVEQLKFMETHFADLAKKVFPATVNIQMGMAQGTGVCVSSDGYILTAAHVIAGPEKEATITFMNEDGTVGRAVKATPLGVERGVDSGMLKIKEESESSKDDEVIEDFPYLDVGVSDVVENGQWVMAVGHPGGLDKERGLVVRVGRVVFKSKDVLKTDCTLVGGDSGGPLVDMNGDVIGIHSRIGQSLLDNFHVPADTYAENWDQLAQGLVLDGKPSMGFSVDEDTNKVEAVTKDGPADKAGFEEDDLIVKIEGMEIASRSDIHRAVRELGLKPKMEVEFSLLRDGMNVTVKMQVGEKKTQRRLPR
jgi:serine protease Do